MHIRALAASFTGFLLAVTIALPANAGSSEVNDPESPDYGNATGGDVSQKGVDETPVEMQRRVKDKLRVAAAYRRAKGSRTKRDLRQYRSERDSFEKQWAVDLSSGSDVDKNEELLVAATRDSDAALSRAPFSYTKKLLNVPHYAQINNFFCGPGSGKMMLKYLREGKSAYNGAPQFQGRIGGKGHMNTWGNGKTGWASGKFRVGVNRWRQGKIDGYYDQWSAPASAGFKTALAFNIDKNLPMAADTVELRNDDHYNNHPKSLEIGHWIVVRGYSHNGGKTYFVDPATSVYPAANKRFNKYTKYFTNTFLQHNGILW